MAEGIWIARCDNNQCVWFGRRREVTMPVVGKGLTVLPGILCECGQQPVVSREN